MNYLIRHLPTKDAAYRILVGATNQIIQLCVDNFVLFYFCG